MARVQGPEPPGCLVGAPGRPGDSTSPRERHRMSQSQAELSTEPLTRPARDTTPHGGNGVPRIPQEGSRENMGPSCVAPADASG